MNPLVKKTFHWLAETILFCFLEIILEVIVHNWNRCIEVFNLDLKPFDIEYLFGISNVYDVSTLYDADDFIQEVISKNLIVLDGIYAYTTVPCQDTRNSVFPVPKVDCKLARDSFNFDKNEEGTKNVVENFESADFNFGGLQNQHLSISTDTFNENPYLHTAHNFENLVHIKDKLNIEDTELEAINATSVHKYSTLEDDFKLAGDSFNSDKVKEDEENGELENYESADINIERLQNHHASISTGTSSYLPTARNCENSVHVNDYLSLEEKRMDNEKQLNAKSMDSISKYSTEEDKLENILSIDIAEYKRKTFSRNYETSENEQRKCHCFNSSIDGIHENICSLCKNLQDFQNISSRFKYNLNLEDKAFSSLYDELGKSNTHTQSNFCTSTTESKCNFFNDDVSQNNTGETFSLSLTDITEKEKNCTFEESFSRKINRSTYNKSNKRKRQSKQSKKKFQEKKISEDKAALLVHVPEKFTKDIEKILFSGDPSSESLSTKMNRSTYDNSNKTRSDGKSENTGILDKEKASLSVHLSDDCAEHNEENIFEDPSSNNLKYEKKKKSEGNYKDKRKVYFKDEVKTYSFNPFSVRNFSSEKICEASNQDIFPKENAFTNVVIDEKDEKLKYVHQTFDQNRGKLNFTFPDFENIVCDGKAKTKKYWQKINLSRHFYHKKKNEEKDKNEDPGKWLSWKRFKFDHKSISDRFFSNVLKK